MSKKKAFSGSTMTLKDFHGGSIPSDLPLPSAPGVIVRPSDRPGFDRQTSLGRPDYRLRPSSSPGTRPFNDKTPFLPPTVHIGRNFDEDERKPLSGISSMSRTVIGEVPHHNSSIRMEMKPDLVSTAKLGRQGLTSSPQQQSSTASSYSARATEGSNLRVNSHNLGGNNGPPVSRAFPNAWAVRKEAIGVNEPMQSAWSESVAASKMAHASALDKISSGRWQTNQSMVNHRQADIEVIQYSETNTFADTEIVPKEKNFAVYSSVGQPIRMDDISSGLEVKPSVPVDAMERPKLKLLPRSKPVAVASEPPVVDYKQGNQWQTDIGHSEYATEMHATAIPARPVSAGAESGNKVVERPKLNLKPRSQPLQHLNVPAEKKGNTLFGGARPRELVLKERGVDDAVVENHDLLPSPNRIKHETPKTTVSPRVPPGRLVEKPENQVGENRISKTNTENWRNENWKNNNRINEPPQQQERPRSPETWRKQAEPQPNTEPSVGSRPGKTASALELAQAFSNPMSDPTMAENFSGSRGKVPFSRLVVASSPRPQINGY